MRGNTNVKDGIFLNATVDTYEVATGENIVAGNMVTMYTENGEPTSGATNTPTVSWITNLHKLTNGKYIGLPNKILAKQANGSFVIENTLSSNIPANGGTVYVGNNTFVLISASLSGTEVYVSVTVYVLDVTNYTITQYSASKRSGTDVINGTGDLANCIVDKINNVPFGYFTCQNKNSATVKGHSLFHVDLTDVTSPNIVFDDTRYANYSYFYPIQKYSRFIDGNTHYYCDNYSVYKIYFNGNTLVCEQCQIRISGTMYNACIYKVTPTEIGIIYKRSNSSYVNDLYNLVCSVSNFVKTGEMKDEFIFDITNGNMTSLGIIQITPTISVICTAGASSNGSEYTSVLNIGNELTASEPARLGYRFDGFLTISDMRSISDFDVDFGTYVASAKVENSEFILVGENKKYVKNATNEIYVRGVAKQSGTAGDTIEVYIPSV